MGSTTHLTDSSNILDFNSNTTMDNTTRLNEDIYRFKNDT